MKLFSSNEALLNEREKEAFDGKKAKEAMTSGEIPQSSVNTVIFSSQPNPHIDKDEYFLSRGDAATSSSTVRNLSGEIKCLEEWSYETLETLRKLHITLKHHPKVESKSKACLGHLFRVDEVSEKRDGKFYHRTDLSSCDYFESFPQEMSPERWEEIEQWVELKKIPDSLHANYQLISKQCIEPATVKYIEGQAVYRPCWEEKLTFNRTITLKDECTNLRQRGCTIKSKRCLEQGKGECQKWEKVFICGKGESLPKADVQSIPSLDFEDDSSIGASMPDTLTKLGIFGDMEKELETSMGEDASKVPLFSGSSYRCSRSVLENVFYDCCDTMKGLATQAGVAKCDPEEITLANLKEEGRCHYIGKYFKKIALGIKKDEVRTYCCFSSKLARLLQEQGRNQLQLSWGTPKQPSCRGLTSEEISQINFDKIDLSEAFDMIPVNESDFESRLHNFQSKLENEYETNK